MKGNELAHARIAIVLAIAAALTASGCWRAGEGTPSAPDADTDTDTDTDIDSDSDSDSDTGTDTGIVDADTDTDSDSDSDTDTDTGVEPPVDCGDAVLYASVTIDDPSDLTALEGATHITGHLIVEPNAVTNLDGLESLRCVGGTVIISNTGTWSGNDWLDGLAALEWIGGTLIVTGNEAASHTAFSYMNMPSLARIEGGFVLRDNLISSVFGLEALQFVGPPGLTVEDNGSLFMLDGLAGLHAIDGDLAISSNGSILTLDGFSWLEEISGTLSIRNESALADISGLWNVPSLGGLDLFDLPSLASLAGLESVTAIAGDLSIARLYALADLDGLSGLTEVGGYVSIHSNDALAQIDGLGGLTHAVGIDLSSCPSLASLDGLGNLATVDESLSLADLGVADLAGLGSLEDAGGLHVGGNSQLASLDGLDSLVAPTGDIAIGGNPLLADLTGLEGIESIGGTLSVIWNEGMQSLQGVEGLGEAGGLEIESCGALVDVDALDGLTAFAGDLTATDNLSLPTCEIVQLALELDAIGTIGALEIHGNGPDPVGGCDGVDPEAGADGDTDTDTDADTDAQCADQGDFAFCALDTTATAGADVSYDICIDGACHSPATCLETDCNAPGPHFEIPASVPTGYVRTMLIADQPIVQDPSTGLTWQGCEAGKTGAACTGMASTFNWIPAVLYCDDLVWGSYGDWYLPDIYELHSIASFALTIPAIDSVAFPGTSGGSYPPTLSSTVCPTYPESAMSIAFYDGSIGAHIWSWWGHVRCVRRGEVELPLVRFVRAIAGGDPVVSDAATDLMWQGCAAGQTGDHCGGYYPFGYDRGGAVAYCEALSWGGHSDWRLPSIKELVSLLDTRVASGALIDHGAFPTSPTLSYWSSSDALSTPAPAGFVLNLPELVEGAVPSTHYLDASGAALVRCVRELP